MIYNAEARLWLPDDSVKMDRCWRFITRNVQDLDAGIAWTKKKGHALQAGGHVGIFPNYLAKFFDTVFTFEPDPELYDCLEKNALQNVNHSNSALFSESGVGTFKPSVSGTGRLDAEGSWTVSTLAFDELFLPLHFIHLDVEGEEVEVLRGAAKTIERCSPVIQLEILPRFKDRIYTHMDSIGYRVVCDTRRDHVFMRIGK